jgi:hypothetical protein
VNRYGQLQMSHLVWKACSSFHSVKITIASATGLSMVRALFFLSLGVTYLSVFVPYFNNAHVHGAIIYILRGVIRATILICMPLLPKLKPRTEIRNLIFVSYRFAARIRFNKSLENHVDLSRCNLNAGGVCRTHRKIQREYITTGQGGKALSNGSLTRSSCRCSRNTFGSYRQRISGK